MSILDYIFYFFFYSFIGWFGESCYCSYKPKKWINRGFLKGPLCPIYGTGALVILITLVPLRNLTNNLYLNEALIFIVGMVVCDIVEYLTSYIMEKLFNARWWDYSNQPFNLNGRICLTHTLYWGTASCLFTFVVHPIISLFIVNQINPISRNIITYIVLVVFIFDLIATVINALGIRNISIKLKGLINEGKAYTVTYLSDKISEERKLEALNKLEDLEEKYNNIKDSVKSKHYKSYKRLFASFPKVKESVVKDDKYLQELINELKIKLNNFKNK